ncbi:MAG TPA: aminotransferase class I/II-fold pyridoxal phosphate-dependent enzyme [Oscillospiraceae bacterium]|nr:aminotransferase class I/II-fold pyridoxal phosphate-dependent enzyme [Oscillospiraceae bacterium]
MVEHMNPALFPIEKSTIREFTRLARETPGCIFLTIGEPDFPTSDPVKDAAKAALDADKTHYPEGNGEPYLRRAIADFEAAHHVLRYSPDEVIVTVGATEAIFTALFGILEPGDEVIVPMPAFPLYEAVIRLCRGVCVPLDTAPDGFQITEERLAAALSPRTKAIFVNSPNNPTGCILSEASLRTVRDAVLERNIFLLSDEVYRDLLYTDDYPTLSGRKELREKLIVIQSFSKPYAMTGWRVGYLLADEPVKAQLEKVHQYAVVSVNSFIQDACVTALGTSTDAMRETYRARRDYVYGRLCAMGLEVQKPEGAFYIFPSVARFGLSSADFCARMIREGLLAAVPGSCFGTEGFIRLSYCYGDETLHEGMDRLERFIRTL